MTLRRRKKNRRVGSKRSPVSGQPWMNPRRRRVVLIIVLAVFVVGSGWQLREWMQGLDSLTLKQVRVKGSFEHVSRAEVQVLLKPYAGQSFFDLDVFAIKSLLQKQPWIRQAAVRRQWPDGLEISLIEQHPLARWGAKGLINDQAEVFFPQAGLPEGLPRLDGVDNSEPLLLARLRDVDELFKPLGVKITAMRLDDRRSWRIELDNGLQLMLGREQGMQRIQRFVAFYPALLAARADQVGAVDLRYPNGIVLRWRERQDSGDQVG